MEAQDTRATITGAVDDAGMKHQPLQKISVTAREERKCGAFISSEDMLLMVQMGWRASPEKRRPLEYVREDARVQEGMPDEPRSMGIPGDDGG